MATKKKKTTTRKTRRRQSKAHKRNGARTSKKTAKAAKTDGTATGRTTSVLDAAARVLGESKQPMRCLEMIDVILKKSSWTTKGKTPAATLSAAIGREIQSKGADARFRKVERGRYAVNAG